MDEQYTGSRISQARKDKGWTQKDLADRLHVSAAAVSKWERGLNFPDISLLQPLAHELDVSVAELLGLENETVETAVLAITQISKSEETQKNKKVKIVLLLAISVLIAACIIAWSNQLIDPENVKSVIDNLYYHSAGINFLSLYFGLFSWLCGIGALFSERRLFNVLSAAFCPIAMLLDTILYANASFDMRYSSIISNLILLAGTLLLNLCSVAIYGKGRQKALSSKTESVNSQEKIDTSNNKIKWKIVLRKILNILFLVHIFFGPFLVIFLLTDSNYVFLSIVDSPLFIFIEEIAIILCIENISADIFPLLVLLYVAFICSLHILSHRIFYKPEQSKKIKTIVIIILSIDIILNFTLSLANSAPELSIPFVTIVFDLLYIALSFNMIPFWAKQEDIEKWEQARTEKAKQKAALSSSVEATAPQEEP